MPTIQLEDAEHQLLRLSKEAEEGEEIILTRGDGAQFKLVPVGPKPARPTFGSAKGDVWISDDFDAPLDDFGDYMSA